MADAETPILPAHIEETVRAIAKLHSDHRDDAAFVQRLFEQLTARIGRPGFIVLLGIVVVLWAGGNLAADWSGRHAWDPAPFYGLQSAVGVLALFVTVLILTTQRREDELATYREQLTLELAILAEQKAAKIVGLLEEIRREHPELRNRIDHEASALAIASDPEAVLDAIKDTADAEPPGAG